MISEIYFFLISKICPFDFYFIWQTDQLLYRYIFARPTSIRCLITLYNTHQRVSGSVPLDNEEWWAQIVCEISHLYCHFYICIVIFKSLNFITCLLSELRKNHNIVPKMWPFSRRKCFPHSWRTSASLPSSPRAKKERYFHSVLYDRKCKQWTQEEFLQCWMSLSP